MYVARDTRDAYLYRGKNVQDLCDHVEGRLAIPTDTLPPRYASWSNSRRITYLVEAGYIVPFAGPHWFMGLSWYGAELNADQQPISRLAHIDLIDENGIPIYDCRIEVTQWPGRNHVRLVIYNDETVLDEIFFTEEGLHNMWICMGRVIGFSRDALLTTLSEMPSPKVYTPIIPPELFMGIVVDEQTTSKEQIADYEQVEYGYNDVDQAEALRHEISKNLERIYQEAGRIIGDDYESRKVFNALVRSIIIEYQKQYRRHPARSRPNGHYSASVNNDTPSQDDYLFQH